MQKGAKGSQVVTWGKNLARRGGCSKLCVN